MTKVFGLKDEVRPIAINGMMLVLKILTGLSVTALMTVTMVTFTLGLSLLFHWGEMTFDLRGAAIMCAPVFVIMTMINAMAAWSSKATRFEALGKVATLASAASIAAFVAWMVAVIIDSFAQTVGSASIASYTYSICGIGWFVGMYHLHYHTTLLDE